MTERFSRLRAWLQRRRWLFRLVLTFALTSLVLTAILLVLVTRLVSGELVNQADSANRELLAQAYRTIDYTLNDLYTEYYQLWRKDPDIRSIILGTSQDAPPTGVIAANTLDERLAERLKFSVDQTNLVHSVYLIDYAADHYWSSYSPPGKLGQISDPSALTFIDTILQDWETSRKDVFFARDVRFDTKDGPTDFDLISFFFIDRDAQGQAKTVFLVNLDRLKFSQLIQSHADSGAILLVSPGGEIIADTSGQKTGQSIQSVFRKSETFDRLLRASVPQGSFIASTVTGDSLVTWQKAGTMGYYLLDIMPLNALYNMALGVNRQLILYFLASLLVSLLAGLWSLRVLYKPLQRLIDRIRFPGRTDQPAIDEFSLLDAAFTRYEVEENQRELRHLLQGTVSDAGRHLYLPTASNWVGLCLLTLDEQPLPDVTVHRCDLDLRSVLGISVVQTAPDCLSTLLAVAPDFPADTAQLAQQVNRLLEQLTACSGLTFVAGVGASVDQLEDARTSHRQALVAAQQIRLSASAGASQSRIQFYEELGFQLNPMGNKRPSPVADIKAFIHENLANPDLTLDLLAERAGLSAGYLRQIFKQETGQTINDYLIQCRLEKACDLLKTTSQPAREIAVAVGYLDSRYFYTLFKKRMGQTTEQYRQTHQ